MPTDEQVKIAMNGCIELFNLALQRGLFRNVDENSAHLAHLSVIDTFVRGKLAPVKE